MSVLFGRAPERRQWGIVPPIPPNSSTGGGGSFADVDLARAEASLQKVAVWACVSLIRAIVEVLPLDVLTGEGSQREQLPAPSWLRDLNGDGHGLPDWCSQEVYSAMLRGNAVGLITERDARTARPRQIVLQHPDKVSVEQDRDGGHVVWRVNGKQVDRSRIWHRRVNSVPGQVLGLSPIALHALTVGTGVAAMRFGAQWFQDGAHPSALLTTDGPLGPEKAQTAKDRFMAALRGRREPLVLGNGWKFQSIQIAPNESQFLETMKFTGAECCRIFGPALAEVLGYDTGGNLTYANIEQRSLDLLTYAADPWLVRLERMLTELLPNGQYVKFQRAALVKTDLLSRYQAHNAALQNRWKTVNEVRDDEDMKAVAWGDEPNFTTYAFTERVNVAAEETVDGPPTEPPPPTPDPAVPSGGPK